MFACAIARRIPRTFGATLADAIRGPSYGSGVASDGRNGAVPACCVWAWYAGGCCRADSWPPLGFGSKRLNRLSASSLQKLRRRELRLECVLVRPISAYARGLAARARTNRRVAHSHSEREGVQHPQISIESEQPNLGDAGIWRWKAFSALRRHGHAVCEGG
jgi:hypothetical protein